MDETKQSCSTCGSELDENGSCPQCAKDIEDAAKGNIPEEGNETPEINPEAETDAELPELLNENVPSARKTGKGIFAGIIAGTLVIGLAIGYIISVLFGGGSGNVKNLSGPWSGTMAFTKITSSDKNFEKSNQAGLNQDNGMEIDIYMYDNKTGGAKISGLNEAGATSPLTYSNGKMKFSVSNQDITVAFDCTITKDKTTGNRTMKGTFKYTGNVPDSTGKKVDINAAGRVNLSLKKK